MKEDLALVRELFLGASGDLVSAMMILLMLMLMLSMSIRLMLSRKKKAYFSLTLSLLLISIQYAFIAALGTRLSAVSGGMDLYLVKSLETLSFIALNVGLYQLYNTTRRKVKWLTFLGVTVTVLLVVARHYAAANWFPGAAESPSAPLANAFLNIWMDIYLYVLIFVCYYFVTPVVGQTVKYQTALLVYFLTHSAEVLNGYVYDDTSEGLQLAAHFLPVVFFFIVFLFIFERVLELMQAVYHSSITDGLTGLYNRRFFMRRVQQYLQAGVPISVIFTDIDNFKKLNDTKGHQQGDEALRRVASIAADVAEEIGLAGRYGGEEIVLVVTEAKIDPAAVAERLRARVEAEAGVTISVGYAKARKGVTAEQLTKQADEAMYVSKKSGKNRVTAFKPGLPGGAAPKKLSAE